MFRLSVLLGTRVPLGVGHWARGLEGVSLAGALPVCWASQPPQSKHLCFPTLSYHNVSASEPAIHGLTPLKPQAKLNLFHFRIQRCSVLSWEGEC